jgi:hypothetical protein
MRTNDKVVNAVDLTKDRPTIDTVFVSRIFGAQNMYMDDTKFDLRERRHMETKLSHIERDAGRIIARVVDAHMAEKESITLTRLEKDLLRKFLFVMKYRSPIFFRRFNHQLAEEYDSSDRDEFLEYMRERNFTRPLDVWFDNLLKIIDAKLDPAGKWTRDLADVIYPPDAEWLFNNIRSMHLAFVTPADSSEEFILTDNAFSIHEGPGTVSVDRFTGKKTLKIHNEFHLVNVISPQLAMILRDNMMPEPLEDVDIEVRKWKRDMLAAMASMHIDPVNATSMLFDLPVAKARNSYTTLSNGRLILAQGADGMPRRSDNFTFEFFRLQSRHTQLINTIMLDQAHHASMLVYKSEKALRKALEFYLDYPTQSKGGHSIKTITDLPDDPMLLLFRKLEYVAHGMGSAVKAKYHVDPLMDDDVALPINQATFFVLKTAKPIVTSDFLNFAMVILEDVLQKAHKSIRAVHAIDQVLMADGSPTYPELLFCFVRQANPASFNEYTIALPAVDLRTWMMAWDILVQRASQQTGGDCKDDVNNMQAALGRLGSKFVTDLRQNSVYKNDACIVRHSSGLSKRGIMKAFDTIGRDEMTSDINRTEPITETSDPSPRLEASPTSSRQSDAKEELLRAPLKLERCIDIQTTKQDNDGVDIFDSQPLFKLIAIILLGALWWLD